MCDHDQALQVALGVAYRHADAPDTSPRERECILAAMVAHLPSREAEVAAQILHHLREQQRLQLTLAALFDGVGRAAPKEAATSS